MKIQNLSSELFMFFFQIVGFRVNSKKQRKRAQRFLSKPLNLLRILARPAGFEPTTPWFVASSAWALFGPNNQALSCCVTC